MRIFITHIVPHGKVAEYNMSFAACNFSYNLIGGGIFDTVYSILPTFVKGEVEAFDGLIYSRLRKCKGMLYRLAPIMECFSAFGKIPRKASVWYYNCTTLNITLMILLKLFKPGVKQNIIQLDYTPSESFLARLCLRIANSLNGTISLAPSPLFTCPNIACLPGVVPDDYPEQPKVSQTRISNLRRTWLQHLDAVNVAQSLCKDARQDTAHHWQSTRHGLGETIYGQLHQYNISWSSPLRQIH